MPGDDLPLAGATVKFKFGLLHCQLQLNTPSWKVSSHTSASLK